MIETDARKDKKMIKAPQLDWNRIEAARQNAHYLRSVAARDIAVAVRDGLRRLISSVHIPKGNGTSPAGI